MRLFLKELGENKDKEVSAEELRERIDNFLYDDSGYFNCTLTEIDNSGDLHFEIEYYSIYS